MLNYNREKPLIAFIVPTGIGASIGGYAGDASLYAKKFAQKFNVIVNPNVVNAACFSGITENMLYVEGWSLNEFVKGKLNLIPSQNNKIGVIFDKGISEKVKNIHINTINAVKTIYGVNITGYEITKEECGVEFYTAASGISTGRVKNNNTLKEAGENLIKQGAQAIAVVCKFEEPPEDNYQDGEGVDIVGGVEAVISHYLTRELKVPCVHAPAFEDVTIKGDLVSPKAAAEYITPTFLPCILLGLSNAPLISYKKVEQYIARKDLKAIIVPYNSLGSSIVADAVENNLIQCRTLPPTHRRRTSAHLLKLPLQNFANVPYREIFSDNIKVYAVKENKSVLNITKNILKLNDIIEVETYNQCFKILEETLYAKK